MEENGKTGKIQEIGSKEIEATIQNLQADKAPEEIHVTAQVLRMAQAMIEEQVETKEIMPTHQTQDNMGALIIKVLPLGEIILIQIQTIAFQQCQETKEKEFHVKAVKLSAEREEVLEATIFKNR